MPRSLHRAPRAPSSAHLLLVAVTALFVLRGASCLRVERPYPAPTAAALVTALQQRNAAVRSIRAETRMTHHSDQGRIKGTVRLMAQQGGKLRFDALTPLDTPLATLVSNGKDFALVDAQQNRHYYGPASPCNIARLIQVVMNPDEVLATLAGGTPLIPHTQATLRWDEREGLEVLTLSGRGLTQTIRLDGRNKAWDLVSSEIRKGDKLLLRIEASGHRALAGLRAPVRIHILQPLNKAELTIRYRKEELNLTLPAAAWELPEAGGLPSQRVECTTVIQRKEQSR